MTIVKTIGATGRDYSTFQAWEDASPTNLTTVEKYTCGTFSGSFTIGETVTGGTSGQTAKLLETDNSTYMILGNKSGAFTNGEQLTGGTSSQTCNITTPATDTSGCIWKGEAYNDAEFSSGDTIISGQTTDSTRYMWLTAADGESFQDHADKATNPLRYDQSKGVGYKRNTASFSIQLTISTAHTRVERIQFFKSVAYGYARVIAFSVSGTTIKDCIVEYRNLSYGGIWSTGTHSPASRIINTVCISSGATTGGRPFRQNAVNVYLINCTALRPTDTNTSGTGISAESGAGHIVINCASFGDFTTCFAAISGASFDASSGYNASSDATAPGSNSLTSQTTADCFEDPASATASDARLKSGSPLIDTGNTDATYAPNDINGTVRGTTTDGDIGAHEFVAAATPTTSPSRHVFHR